MNKSLRLLAPIAAFAVLVGSPSGWSGDAPAEVRAELRVFCMELPPAVKSGVEVRRAGRKIGGLADARVAYLEPSNLKRLPPLRPPDLERLPLTPDERRRHLLAAVAASGRESGLDAAVRASLAGRGFIELTLDVPAPGAEGGPKYRAGDQVWFVHSNAEGWIEIRPGEGEALDLAARPLLIAQGTCEAPRSAAAEPPAAPGPADDFRIAGGEPPAAPPTPPETAPPTSVAPPPAAAGDAGEERFVIVGGSAAVTTKVARPEADQGPSPPPLSGRLAAAVAEEERARADRRPLSPAKRIKLYAAVAEAEPQNAEARYRLGLALSRAGEPRESLGELERAVALAPAEPRYLVDYGSAALQMGERQKALQACATAAAKAPTWARAHNALGNAHLESGENEKAAAAYAEAVRLDPHHAGYLHNLARAVLRGGQPRRALEILNEVLRLNPNCAEAYNDRATANEQLRDRRKALDDYRAAVKYDPELAVAWHNLGLLYANVEEDPLNADYFDALECAERAVKLTDRKNARFLMGLAESQRANRKYDLAVATAEEALRLDPRREYQDQLARYRQLQKQGVAVGPPGTER